MKRETTPPHPDKKMKATVLLLGGIPNVVVESGVRHESSRLASTRRMRPC